MEFNAQGHKDAIQNELTIINKNKQEVPFVLNRAQNHFIQQVSSQDLVILKARKLGFSSVILAIAILKFIFGQNERCVSMSFDAGSAGRQLERAKHFLRSFERKNNQTIPLKYNSKNEMVYEGFDQETGNTFINTLRIGTAKSGSFGRGDDISLLHITEFAFCPNIDELLSGVSEAVVNGAPRIFETTANGYGEFKEFWDNAVLGINGYVPLFYSSDWEYTKEFLEEKRKRLGDRLFRQEYPSTPEEAFLTSGECYFDTEVLGEMLKNVKEPLKQQIYV